MADPISNDMSEFGLDVFHKAEMLATMAANKIGEETQDGTQAIYVTMAAVGGTLKILAELISAGKEGDSVHGMANKESMLVAGLYAARTFIPWKRVDDHGVILDFNSRNFIASVEAACTIAGKDIKPYLNQHLLTTFGLAVQKSKQSTGYWDYVPDVGPQFDGMVEALTNLTRH